MGKHTPGPWALKDVDIAGGYVMAGQTVIHDFTFSDMADPNEWEAEQDDDRLIANARLIAASPMILDALIRALPTVEHMYHTTSDPDGSLWDDVVACRAAIAKATGAE